MIQTLICLGLFLLAVLSYGMLRKKKEIALIGLLSVFSVVLSLACGYELPRTLAFLGSAIFVFLIMNFYPPDLLIRSSIPIYAATVILLAFCAFFATQRIGYYVSIGSFYVDPSKFLMLTVLPISYLISRKQTIGTGTVLGIALMVCVELLLAVYLRNLRSVFIIFIVCLALLFKSKAEKRLSISWALPIGIVALFVAASAVFFSISDYLPSRLELILSRGESNPLGGAAIWCALPPPL